MKPSWDLKGEEGKTLIVIFGNCRKCAALTFHVAAK